MSTRRLLVPLLAGLVLLAAALAAWRALPLELAQEPPIKARLATAPFLYSALIAIADEMGLFRQAGLDLTIEELPAGRAALKRLSEGQALMATASDQAFAVAALADPSLVIVASVASSDTHEMLARKDRAINTPADLKGKRIGVSFGTSGQYYLPSFLLMNGIETSEVEVVDIAPERIVQALEQGLVDAVLTWEIYAFEVVERLGDGVVSWPAQNYQDFYWVLVVRRPVEDSAPVVRRMLKALSRASDFAAAHPDEARDMVRRSLGFSREFMDRYWLRTRLGLALDQALVVSLEDAAALKLGSEEAPDPLPNPLDWIDERLLETANPSSVTIFK